MVRSRVRLGIGCHLLMNRIIEIGYDAEIPHLPGLTGLSLFSRYIMYRSTTPRKAMMQNRAETVEKTATTFFSFQPHISK